LIKLSRNTRTLIGMVHVGALPGAPANDTSVDLLAAQAANEALILAEAGFDAIMIENMHDRPYVHGDHGPHIAAAMTRIGLEVANVTNAPLGVQVLSGGNREALAIAQAIGGSFIRCENFVFSHVADEGLLVEAEAGRLLRYRKMIGVDHVKICCDLKKKHASHAVTADISIGEAAEAAEFFGADAVVVTGTATGKPTDVADIQEVRRACSLPVLVGSGVTTANIGKMFEFADALIIGSSIKKDGKWFNGPDPARCREIVKAANKG